MKKSLLLHFAPRSIVDKKNVRRLPCRAYYLVWIVCFLFISLFFQRRLMYSIERTPTALEEHFFGPTTGKSTAPVSFLNYTAGKPALFAYAFVVGGCDPDQPNYRYYLYNILVSTYILRHAGSKSDVIVYIQMTHNSKHEKLPDSDVASLSAMNIRISYIPKSSVETFYGIVLEKFRILNLLQYQRVLLLDADVMPLVNLDYLMEMSLQGVLMENVVVAGLLEPANAGLFILKPDRGRYQRVKEIILETQKRSSRLSFPDYWDKEVGWGHVMKPSEDYWENSRMERNHLWDFHASFSDQGLLYYWVKYERKSVSIVFPGGRVQNWGTTSSSNSSASEAVKLLETLEDPFAQAAPQAGSRCLSDMRCRGPVFDDHVHFTGQAKPWLTSPPQMFLLTSTHIDEQLLSSKKKKDKNRPGFSGSNLLWYKTLYTISNEFNLHIDFDNWKVEQHPLLGYYATPIQAAMTRWAIKNLTSSP